MREHCAICNRKMQNDVKLRKDDDFFTQEHIFPACIGGSWTENSLICKRCNSQLGHEADYALCKALNQISTILNIKNSRNGNWPHFDFEKDGQKFRILGEEGRITKLEFSPPTLSHDGRYITAAGPRGSEKHIDKSLRGYAKRIGWNITGQEKRAGVSHDEIAPEVPVEVNFNIRDTNIRLGIAKIALLSLAAQITPAQAQYINLGQFFDDLINGRANKFTLISSPDGTQFFRNHAHAVLFHRLNDNQIGVQVFFFGAITAILTVDIDHRLPFNDLPLGVVILPQCGIKQEIPNPRWNLGKPNPELGHAALKQAMDEAIQIGEKTAAFKRAWSNAGINGQPFEKDLTAEELVQVCESLERELTALTTMPKESEN